VDKRRIALVAPIKTVGAHQATISLHPEVSVRLDLEVVGA
jgi:large subunit ribosomal protein L9